MSSVRLAGRGFRAPWIVGLLVAGGCGPASTTDSPGDLGTDELAPFYPALPPEGGARVCAAGRLTDANYDAERVKGPASQGLPGDYFLRNDRIRVVLQAPGRNNAVLPYGGNPIDLDRIASPAGDQIGEVGPVLQLGRTVDFQDGRILRDGSAGGPAAVRFIGHDVVDTYFNITGIGGTLTAVRDEYRADVALGLTVAVTYVLNPGSDALEIYWTYFNPASVGDMGRSEVATTYGVLTDTGADIDLFHPFTGFGGASFSELLQPQKSPGVEYGVLQGQGIAYGIVPRYAAAETRGASLAIAGIAVELLEVKSLLDILTPAGQSLRVPAGQGVTRRVDLVVGKDAADLERAVRVLKGEAPVALSGTVKTGAQMPVPGARVIVEDTDAAPDASLITAATTDDAGAFSVAVRPGKYRLTAETEGYLRSAGAPVTVDKGGGAPARVDLSLMPAAAIRYKVRDRQGNAVPSKIVVVGTPPAIPDGRFRDLTYRGLPRGVGAWLTSIEGDSERNTRYDHAIVLPPGRYRVVVGRGPEWSRFDRTLDLPAEGVMLDVVLDRVLDTTGYVAGDFHQHTYFSPDAPVPPADRVVGYLAEGVEFVSTTEHDVHFDLEPVLKSLGADRLMDSMVGVEVTPFDYGHFIAYPMRVDPMQPNGGAFDWGRSATDGLRVAPGGIFRALRGAGARVVQMCHPRSAWNASVESSFQSNFDRAGLTYDFVGRSFGGSRALAPLEPVAFGLPDDAALFSPDFDTMEVANGLHGADPPTTHTRLHPIVEQTLRDYMNFLSFGFTPTALGDSDSHGWFNAPPGLPRSLVRVPDDSERAIALGLGDAVVATLRGDGKPRDVVVTNGPMLSLTVDGKGLGEVAAPAPGAQVTLAVRVQSTTWAPVDTVEIYANAAFQIPVPKGQLPADLRPVLCFTSRPKPIPSCARAVQAPLPLTVRTVEVAPAAGGTPAAARVEGTASLMINPEVLIGGNGPSARGKDAWLVALASGDGGTFPTLPIGVADDITVDDLVEKRVDAGAPPFALTNPVFVDADGGGWKAPYAP